MWFTFETENARPIRSNTMVTEEGERRRQFVMKCEAARLETKKFVPNKSVKGMERNSRIGQRKGQCECIQKCV